MALTKEQKQAQVHDLTKMMTDASSVIFANYIGLSVSEISELRNKLREGGAEMKVAKKTLMGIAAKDAKLPDLENASMDGPVSLIFSYDDPLSGAQIAFKFSKEHNKVALIGGVFEGSLLSPSQAMDLAQMPSREGLLSMFATMIRSPLVSFAGMCNSPLTGFARALNEMSDKGGFGSEDEGQKTEESAKPEEKISEETNGTEVTENPSPDPDSPPATTE